MVKIQNKEFAIYNKDKASSIHLSFLHNPNIATYTFKLNCSEWENLLTFLMRTKSCKKNIFSGFDIAKNKTDYCSIEKCVKEITLIEKIFAENPKELKKNKQSINTTKKHCLYDYISIEKNGVSANLGRTKFIRFRDFCLKDVSKIK